MKEDKCEKCGLEKPEKGESAIGKPLCLCGATITIDDYGVPIVKEANEVSYDKG